MGRRGHSSNSNSSGIKSQHDTLQEEWLATFHLLDATCCEQSRGSTAVAFEFALYVHSTFYCILQNFNIYGTVSDVTHHT
jgi:hypothetical protein